MMTIEWWQIIAAVVAIGGSILAVVRFWFNSAATAEAALKEAVEVRALAQAAHDKLSVLTANIGAYREIQAERLVSREVLSQVETRLTDAIQRLGDRFDKILEQMAKR